MSKKPLFTAFLAVLVFFLLILVVVLASQFSQFKKEVANTSLVPTVKLETSPIPTNPVNSQKVSQKQEEKIVNENKEKIKGKIEGKICYPSSFVPEGYILAKNVETKKIEKTFFEGVPPNSQEYSLMLVPGKYVFAYEIEGDPSGFYTLCAPTMHVDDCSTLESHQLTEVEVVAGKTVENINLCDYYYQPEHKPSF